jgi:uncharacterized SAM-binding protein YcdF (DUF218 family)
MTFPVVATSPLPYAVAGAIVLGTAWRHLPRALAVVILVIEIVLVLLTTPAAANLLVRSVESRAPPKSACTAPRPTTIVVLASGFRRTPTGPGDYAALQRPGLERVFAGVALWRKTPHARLVLSGGGRQRVPQAVAMANLAVQLGVPAAAIDIEDHSDNTWQNARNVAALLPAVPRRIWLVSSPLHLPRALQAFRAWGFKPCVWPSGPKAPSWTGLTSLVPRGGAVRSTAVALHELIGSIEYAVLAWRHARRAYAGNG